LKIADNRPQILDECLNKVVEMFLKGDLKPQVGGIYKVDELGEAHAALESGNTTGKLSVFW
jgi:NADPH2:quinone reductase